MTTNKKKAAPKKRAAKKKDDYLTVNAVNYGYNAIGSAYNNMINQVLRGEPIPTDPEEAAKFWKEKYDSESKRADKYSSQVELLRSIINGAIAKGSNDCNC